MAVMPAIEWPLQLHVFEKFVPPKSRNLRDPSSAQRKWWQHAKRRDDFRANAGERLLLFRRKLSRCCRRRNKTQSINARVRDWKHEAREVRWIRKEEEDLLNRESDPAFELKMTRHGENDEPIQEGCRAISTGKENARKIEARSEEHTSELKSHVKLVC